MPFWSKLKRAVGGLFGIRARTRNIGPLVQWLNSSIPDLFYVGSKDAARQLLDLTKEEAPVRTGKLRDSLRVDWRGKDRFVITEGVSYGKFVRLGTRPHPIFPKTKRALWWPGLERPIAYVKKHPGTRPNPYHLRALARLGGPDTIAEAVLREFRRRDP